MPNVAHLSFPFRRGAAATGWAVPIVCLGLAAGLIGGPSWSAHAAEPSSRLVARQSVCGDVSDTSRRTATSVAMSASGSVLVVGAPAIVTDRGVPGRVYVCTSSSTGWRLATTLRPAFGASPLSVWGTAVAVSADGQTIAVGDEYHSVPGASVDSSGLVDVFRHQSGTWQLAAEIPSPKPQYLGEFGYSVALSADGNRLVVGSPEQFAPNPTHTINYDKGAAWIFTARAGWSGWATAGLPLPTAEFAANFGTAVAVSGDGDTAVVGAVTTGAAVQHDGHAYVYDTAVTTPALTATLLPVHELGYWGFGERLALSADGSTVAVGAPDDAAQGVSVFNRQGPAWTRSAVILPQGTAVGARLGQGVALSADGRTLLMTAPYRAAAGGTVPWVGGGYRFVHDATGWHWGGELAPPSATANQLVGYSLATSADARYALLGAPSAAGSGGQSYIYLQQG
jgi:hypothetical protein